MSQFVCDGTCAGNELGDCNHGDSNDGAPTAALEDDVVRALVISLIAFVASAKAPHEAKMDALDAIGKLRARLLP